MILDTQCTRAQFAQDLLEQVFLRVKSGNFRAGQVQGQYEIWLGDRLYQSRDPFVAWTAVLRDLADANGVSTAEREDLDVKGAAVEVSEAAQDQELIDALTEGGMEPLGIVVQELRTKREQSLDTAFDVLYAEQANGGPAVPNLRDAAVLITELARASGLDEVTPLEVRQVLERRRAREG